MKRMKPVQPPRGDEDQIKGSVDQTKVSRGALPKFSGQGVHIDRRDKRLKDRERKELNNEVAPPGWEGTVKAMKKHKDIDNPWALAWSMKKKGYKSHKGKNKIKMKKKNEQVNGFIKFSEWVEMRQKVDETSMSQLVDPKIGFHPKKTADPDPFVPHNQRNPYFNNPLRPRDAEGNLIEPSQFKGLQSVNRNRGVNTGQFLGYFDIVPNEAQKTIKLDGTWLFFNNLQQNFGKSVAEKSGKSQAFYRSAGNVSTTPLRMIGGETVTDQYKTLYVNFMSILHNAFGQLGAILQHYIFDKGYQKAQLEFIKETIELLRGQMDESKSKSFIDKMLRGLVRDLNAQNKEKGISISYNPQDNTIQRL